MLPCSSRSATQQRRLTLAGAAGATAAAPCVGRQRRRRTAAAVKAPRLEPQQRIATTATAAAAAGASSSSSSSSSAPSYPYNSGDERQQQKATLEHIFRPLDDDADADDDATPSTSTAAAAASSSADRIQAPWAVGFQLSERNLVWNDDLKLRLIKRVAAEELGVDGEELERRLRALAVLLPDLADRLVMAPPARVARLAGSVDAVAARLLRLRAIFPRANVSALVAARLTLLLDDDLDGVAAAAARLRALLLPPQGQGEGEGGFCVDGLVEAFPSVLAVDEFEAALADARRLMPGLDVARALRQNPELIVSNMRGSHLIPYDPPGHAAQQQLEEEEEQAQAQARRLREQQQQEQEVA